MFREKFLSFHLDENKKIVFSFFKQFNSMILSKKIAASSFEFSAIRIVDLLYIMTKLIHSKDTSNSEMCKVSNHTVNNDIIIISLGIFSSIYLDNLRIPLEPGSIFETYPSVLLHSHLKKLNAHTSLLFTHL